MTTAHRGLRPTSIARALGAVVVLLALTAIPAVAQGPAGLRLERVHVSVWPEYDDPRLLILYEGAFVDDGRFPRTVEFPDW